MDSRLRTAADAPVHGGDLATTAAPHWCAIGVQKAGTTWLHTQLEQHPDVWVPPHKELHHFSRESDEPNWALVHKLRDLEQRFADDPRAQTNLNWMRSFVRTANRTDDWYRSLFSPAQGKVAGEVCPSYLPMDRDRMDRFLAIYTRGPLFVLLRHPRERLLSQYRMWLVETDQHHTPEQFRAFTAWDGCRTRSLNAEHIERWAAAAPARVVILFHDDLAARPHWLLERLFTHLGVTQMTPESAQEKVLASRSTELDTETLQLAAAYVAEDARRLADLVGGHARAWARDF